MAKARTSINVLITGDARQLNAALGQATTATGRFQQKMAGFTAGLGKVSLVLGAVGVGAGKMAANFDSSMAKIVGLVGLTADEVDMMRESVLKLSGETAKAPKELADALFFITSAGLRGTDALDALEQAAKASAAGLGDTTVVADALTSAMNAYAGSGLTAEKATNALVAGVREGKLEAESLAGSLGKVIPIASQMGISFEEVVATLAAMSKVGIDAETGSTALRGVMSSLLKPTSQAAATLQQFGTSAGELRKQIREDGLLATLTSLQTKFGDNETALTDVFGNVRALSGVLALLGENSDEVADVFAALADNTGDLNKAFKTAAEEDAFKFQQALADLKVAAVSLGAEAAPVLAGLAETVSGLAKSFSDLSPATKGAAVDMSVLVIKLWAASKAVGALLVGVGGIRKAWKGAELGVLAVRVAAVGSGFTIATTALATFGVAWAAFAVASDLAEVFETGEESAKSFSDTVGLQIANSFPGASILIDGMRQKLLEAGIEMRNAATSADNMAARYMAAGEATQNVAQGADNMALRWMAMGLAASGAATDTDELTAAIRNQQAAADEVLNPLLALVGAGERFGEAFISVRSLQRDGKKSSNEYRDAVLNLAKAQLELSTASATFAVDGGSQAIEVLQTLLSTAGLSQDEIDDLIKSIDALNTKTRSSSGGTIRTSFGGLEAFGDGGVVGGPVGAPRLILAHGGETVLPTHKGNVTFDGGDSGSSTTFEINVNAETNASATEIAAEVNRTLEARR